METLSETYLAAAAEAVVAAPPTVFSERSLSLDLSDRKQPPLPVALQRRRLQCACSSESLLLPHLLCFSGRQSQSVLLLPFPKQQMLMEHLDLFYLSFASAFMLLYCHHCVTWRGRLLRCCIGIDDKKKNEMQISPLRIRKRWNQERP